MLQEAAVRGTRVQVDVVPREAEARCREAVEGCPVEAIAITEG